MDNVKVRDSQVQSLAATSNYNKKSLGQPQDQNILFCQDPAIKFIYTTQLNSSQRNARKGNLT